MYEGYSAQKHPMARWNTARGVWEKMGTESLFCAHLEPFSETWPTEGTMQNGLAYELPTPERHITVSESSLLRSPIASQGEGGALGEDEARKRGNTVGIRDQAMDIPKANGHKVTRSMLPTPVVADAYTGELKSSQHKEGSMHSIALPHAIAMLPTPTTQDGKNNAGPSQFDRNTKPLNVEATLLGTPRTSSANGSSSKQVEEGAPKARLEDQVHTDWGRFEPAVRRWEEVLGRPAPAPTKPDGKDGAHRLSAQFTEWMMGLPEGWITDCGLTRNEQLKACGNGVVPQQAEMALRHLLKGII